MRPFYWRNTTNFGDYLNGWLWEAIFPDLVGRDDDIRLVGVGTLIKSELSYVKGRKIIFGSGLGYGSVPTRDTINDWLFYFVRGPNSARVLGIEPELAVTDGSWLMINVPGFDRIPEKSGRVFVPHFSSNRLADWHSICERNSLRYIDPLGDSKDVISAIAGSELAIVESLHGAIVADLYRTPWIPVVSSRKILPFKWIDWCASVELPYEPVRFQPDRFGSFVRRGLRRRDEDIAIVQPTHAAERFQYRDVNEPHAFYALIQRMKPKLRKTYSGVVENISRFEDRWPLSIWTDYQNEFLSRQLERILQSRSYLSRDAVRDTRINQLNDKVDALRRDYDNVSAA